MEFNNFNNYQAVLVLLPENESEFKQSAPYQNLKSSSAKSITEAPLNNLPADGSYDAILSAEQNFSTETIQQIWKLLKPDSYLILAKSTTVPNLIFFLKVNGFIIIPSNDGIIARKPDYEVGSAVKINLNENQSKKAWTISTDDEDEDLINDEDLLDEQDKVKPSAEELRVCATTKERKACANCSCGLREELEQEEIKNVRENSQNAKSSCGSCYLGDAFRCSGCPYRGMPAFKPGEKVVIDNFNDL